MTLLSCRVSTLREQRSHLMSWAPPRGQHGDMARKHGRSMAVIMATGIPSTGRHLASHLVHNPSCGVFSCFSTTVSDQSYFVGARRKTTCRITPTIKLTRFMAETITTNDNTAAWGDLLLNFHLISDQELNRDTTPSRLIFCILSFDFDVTPSTPRSQMHQYWTQPPVLSLSPDSDRSSLLLRS